MIALRISLIIHFVGIGMLFTTLLGGWILNSQYQKTEDYGGKSRILRMLRPIGLLSPAAILVMIASGIVNVMILRLDITAVSWLRTKLIVFAVTVAIGIYSGIRGARRAEIVNLLAEGKAPEGASSTLVSLDAMQRVFLFLQAILMLVILTLSVVKP
jgi:hypothetical protein